MDWFAINDTELRQFHMAGLVARGGDSVLPVVNGIRERKISYTAEAEKPTANTARQQAAREICPHVYRACRVAGCDCDGRDVFCEIRNGTGKLPLA